MMLYLRSMRTLKEIYSDVPNKIVIILATITRIGFAKTTSLAKNAKQLGKVKKTYL